MADAPLRRSLIVTAARIKKTIMANEKNRPASVVVGSDRADGGGPLMPGGGDLLPAALIATKL